MGDLVVDVGGYANLDGDFSVVIAAGLVAASCGVPCVVRACDFETLFELQINAPLTDLAKNGIAFDAGSAVSAKRCVLLVPNADIARLAELAKTLQADGVTHAILASAVAGNARFDTRGDTSLHQVTGDTTKRRRARSADFGLPENDPALLKIASPKEDATAIKTALTGAGSEQNAPATRERALYSATVMNCAAILLVAEKAVGFQHGAEMARDAIVAGDAQRFLAKLIKK